MPAESAARLAVGAVHEVCLAGREPLPSRASWQPGTTTPVTTALGTAGRTPHQLEGGQVPCASKHQGERQQHHAQAVLQGLLVQQAPHCGCACHITHPLSAELGGSMACAQQKGCVRVCSDCPLLVQRGLPHCGCACRSTRAFSAKTRPCAAPAASCQMSCACGTAARPAQRRLHQCCFSWRPTLAAPACHSTAGARDAPGSWPGQGRQQSANADAVSCTGSCAAAICCGPMPASAGHTGWQIGACLAGTAGAASRQVHAPLAVAAQAIAGWACLTRGLARPACWSAGTSRSGAAGRPPRRWRCPHT